MTKIGFTGTRSGLTEAQRNFILEHLESLQPEEAHHGDCVGADSQFHDIVRKFDTRIKIVVHPGDIKGLRAFCFGDEILKPKGCLDRNRDIVDSVDFMIACPESSVEVQRSGTWSTIRYANRLKRTIYILGGS